MGVEEQGVRPGRYQVIPRTLVFIWNGGDVLLLKGSPDKRIWANRYNGVGGHIEAREDVYTAARREIIEETGLNVSDLLLRGVVNVDVGQDTGIMLFVLTAHSHSRQVTASPEGTLEWVSPDQWPQLDLVEDLPVLLRRLAEMPPHAPAFFARYWYDDQQLRIEWAETV